MDIQKKELPAKTYIGKTKTLRIDELKNNLFFAETFDSVAAYCGQSGIQVVGAPVAMYKTWDHENGTTDVMVAFAVAAGTTSEEYEIMEVPAQEAFVGIHTGAYDGLQGAHNAMMEYTKKHGGTTGIVMEEYLTNPNEVASEADHQTAIIYYA